MAIFTLTDITFTGGPALREGKADTLGGKRYDSNTYKYPLDIGSYDKGHYIVIYINSQEKSAFKYDLTGDKPTFVQNQIDMNKPSVYTSAGVIAGGAVQGANYVAGTDIGKSAAAEAAGVNYASGILNGIGNYAKEKIGESTLGKLSSIANPAIDFAVGATESVLNFAGDGLKNYTRVNGVRTIRRTSDTIALYMPATVNFVTSQGYSETNLGGSLPAALLSGGASAVQSIQKGGDVKSIGDALGKNLSPYLMSYLLNKLPGGFGKNAFTAAYGVVENPMLELLYTSPSLREFRFDFMFYPRSKEEGLEVQKIINRLQFHQAPEIVRESNGYFLVPPSEFDIKFFYNGVENPNVQKMSTCVLTSIDVDYAPNNGWTTYEVPGPLIPTPGGTGMPVGIRVSLAFKETEVMTKDNFAKSVGAVNSMSVDSGSIATAYPVSNSSSIKMQYLQDDYGQYL